MKTQKLLSNALVFALAAGMVFILSQNLNLSPPKSLGYQTAVVGGFEFDAGRFSASSFITVHLSDGSEAKIAVDSGFTLPDTGQTICLHSATQWFVNTQMHRFASPAKCASDQVTG